MGYYKVKPGGFGETTHTNRCNISIVHHEFQIKVGRTGAGPAITQPVSFYDLEILMEGSKNFETMCIQLGNGGRVSLFVHQHRIPFNFSDFKYLIVLVDNDL